MKKIFSILCVCAVAVSAAAVPARRIWHTQEQADGTTIEVLTLGDEFYHYTVNKDGKEVRLNERGMYEVVGEAPTLAKAQARHAAGQARRARKEVGVEPYPAPRGLLILVNFKDKTFLSKNTKAVMDSLINAKDCQVNGGFGSAAQYFKDQSNGQYQPVFDVYGPVTLSQKVAYYGGNDGTGDDAQDSLATDAVIEACILANQQYSDLDFTNYDWNNDGYVDFVYVIYAGKGEADGGASNTIWPHNYSIQEIVKYYQWGYSHYKKSDTKLDGVYLDNYAMSQELDGTKGTLAGNGTFCHEFGHVIGLPDFYDTSYGTNYSNALTPNDWDVMDGGAYNGDTHCPPNYSVWEKYFMGWDTPVNLGTTGASLTLKANGTDGYQAYQINSSNKLITATTAGECYYIENRQHQGWDSGLPSHGLLIWKVNFNASAWQSNTPNNTANNPRYTLVSASGTKIGTHTNSSRTAYVYDGPKNPYPGSANVTSQTVAGKSLTDITETDGIIRLTYIEATQDVELVENNEAAQKVLCNGQVVIVRGDKIYDLMGRSMNE
jgi:M6 family metalloprotease-like protein